MSKLPLDWNIEHSGERLVLDRKKVAAEIERLRAELRRLLARHGEQATADVLAGYEQNKPEEK